MVTAHVTEPARAALGRRRRARSQAQRGAAVFIVVMVLTLLTAIGIVAVRSTSMADAAAGYDREGAQAALIAQYGITATTAYMATTSGGSILDLIERSKTQLSPAFCEANGLATPGASAPPSCARMTMDKLQLSFTQNSNETVFAPGNQPGATADSTSSLTASEKTNAVFVVELTEAAETGVRPAGNGNSSVMLTLTSIAQVRPTAAAAANTCIASQGQQVMRAMITAQKPPG